MSALPFCLDDCRSLEGPREVRTDDRAARATTLHTGGPVEASVPNVSDSSVEHRSRAIYRFIRVENRLTR